MATVLAIVGICALICLLPQMLCLVGIFFTGIFFLVTSIAAAPIYLAAILGHGLSNLGKRLLTWIDDLTKR